MGHRLLILLLAVSTGCSFAIVRQPPGATCTRSRAPAVADVVIAVTTLLAAAAILVLPGSEAVNASGNPRKTDSAPAGMAVGLVGAGFGISARYGFVHSADCRAAAPSR